jgi:hypothetical protein
MTYDVSVIFCLLTSSEQLSFIARLSEILLQLSRFLHDADSWMCKHEDDEAG